MRLRRHLDLIRDMDYIIDAKSGPFSRKERWRKSFLPFHSISLNSIMPAPIYSREKTHRISEFENFQPATGILRGSRELDVVVKCRNSRRKILQSPILRLGCYTRVRRFFLARKLAARTARYQRRDITRRREEPRSSVCEHNYSQREVTYPPQFPPCDFAGFDYADAYLRDLVDIYFPPPSSRAVQINGTSRENSHSYKK